MTAVDVRRAEPESPRASGRMMKVFWRSWSAWLGTAILVALIVIAVVGPHAYGAQAVRLNPGEPYAHPGAGHLLGTNELGQDVFSRLMVATRLTLELALGSAGIGLGLGVVLGGAATVAGRRLQGVLLRTIDTLLSFPALLIAIFLITIIGPGTLGAMVGVGTAESFYFARISSSMGISIAEQEYVMAARVIGIRRIKLLARYILPNLFETLVIAGSAAVSQCVVTIAAISFLGLGVQFPQYDWGRLLTDGVQGIYEQPWGAVGPAVAIAILAMAFGLIGEAMARASNPRLWTMPPSRRSLWARKVRDARRPGVAGATGDSDE
jgi:peptide/nickel transport system permease protein